MRIVCVSDTHGIAPLEPLTALGGPGAVLVHAGDLTMEGGAEGCIRALVALDDLPYDHVVVVAGNHDFWFERADRKYEIENNFNKIRYLQDSGIEIEGVRFWGSPWQPEFNDLAFNLPRGSKLAEKWALIPEDTQVLVTHGPPMGVLDDKKGCWDLTLRVAQLKSLKLHVFGHIHEAAGVVEDYPEEGVTFVNACALDEKYQPYQTQPYVVEL